MGKNSTTIFCYGDSNTYGYDPRSYLGSRYPKEIRWTGRLQEKFEIKNLGVPGREIPRFEYEMKQAADLLREPLSGLCAPRPNKMYKNNCPPFAETPLSPPWLWIMLGTNDLLSSETITAGEVADRMKTFLDYLTQPAYFQNDRLKIRLIAPPKMQPGTWVSAHALKESTRLGDCMKAIVPAGVAFTDAGQWELPVCFDGVHLTEEGHRIFAKEILKTAFI